MKEYQVRKVGGDLYRFTFGSNVFEAMASTEQLATMKFRAHLQHLKCPKDPMAMPELQEIDGKQYRFVDRVYEYAVFRHDGQDVFYVCTVKAKKRTEAIEKFIKRKGIT